MKPSERAAFDDDIFLALERELVEELVPVRALWTDPLEDQEEEGRDGERLVEALQRLDVLIVGVPAYCQQVEQAVEERQSNDAQNLSLLLWCCVVPHMLPGKKASADGREA